MYDNGVRRTKRDMMDIRELEPEVIEGLQLALLPNGCFRVANTELRRTKGQKYKRGYEARFVVKTEEDLAGIQQLLHRAGIQYGKPYAKGRQFVQPVYGRQQLEWLLAVMQL